MSAKEVYEDVFFYLDLTKDYLSKKDIIKALKIYIEENNKVNLKGHYGLLIFQEEGNPVFLANIKDSKIISKAIEENWKNRPRKESYFENGLFYIFSYIAESVRKKSKKYRVIVITDTPSDLNEEYQDALFNLVDKIKYFPTFIDIIRVSGGETRFFKDDVKLHILASDTKGGIFQVKNKKEFFEVLINKLTKGKRLITTFADRPDEIKISVDDYKFYSNLAKELKPPQSWEGLKCFLCNEVICPVCTDVYDVPFLCEDCNAGFHHCCITNYTITHNIGIPHIFRCPNCDVLLKIDADEITEVQGEEGITTVKEYIGIDDYSDIEFAEGENKPKLQVEIEIPKALRNTLQLSKDQESKIKDDKIILDDNVRKIRIGGFFGKFYSVRKVGNKIIYEKATGGPYQAIVTTEREIKKKNKKEKSKVKKKILINICPICGTPIKKNQIRCNVCGSKLN
ncbi:MAG: RING finger protein [Promethearchaeota archaeon]